VLAALLGAWTPPTDARVTRIVIDTKTSPAFGGQSFGAAGQYETLAGRAFGELDPQDPHNAIIQDIELAPRTGNGKVEYMATFFIVKPTDMSKSSRLLWHDVPNRGGRLTLAASSRAEGDIGLSSGWQGDSAGSTVPGANNDYVVVPIAKNPDGSPITGPVMGRIVNVGGMDSQPMIVHSNPVPYRPATLDTSKASLTTRTSETIDGRIGKTARIKSTDWAWASCSASNPFPGTPDPTRICLKNGFDPSLLYQVVFTARDPYVLGIGFAAFRDVGTFFKHEVQDDAGTPNPLAGGVSWAITRGVSQSGNFIRALLHLGFNQDEAGRQVYEGAWPIIAGRRVALNFRFAMPDGVLKLYEPGSEGPQWWLPWPDPVRNLPTRGILDRCTASGTCPKIIEHFGAAEVWGLKLTPEWVGTAADADIPLDESIRRYYIPSTRHGGANLASRGFDVTPPAVPSCPSANYGRGTFPDNPVPHAETVNAIRFHFRNWVMHGTPPPPSRYPMLGNPHGDHGGHDPGDSTGTGSTEPTLVAATKEDMGFPTIPGVPKTAPTGLINPVLDYDFGPGFDRVDASGVQTVMPPKIKNVIRMLAPKVNADGNELGGVPVVLRDAPLGTYLGWNITAAGFHKGKICNYAGGMIPFARTKAERLAAKDPRPSLEERYGTHERYVEAVQAAAANAVAQGFLLPDDAENLIALAAASNVLK
jgi:hypothetical protein